VAVLAAAAIVSLAVPWLAAREVDDAYAAIEQRQPGKAVDEARRAKMLNPLALEPLLALAAAEEARGNLRAAWERYVEAVDLQPHNWRSWYELGRFELDIDRREAGIRDLRRSRELDPLGPANDHLAAMGL
jgi:Flp pilus assembly protein TadD